MRESWFRWTLHESFFKGNNCYQDDIEIFIYPTTTEWIVNINVDSIQWMTSTFLRILFTQKKTLFAVILTAFFLFSFNYSTLYIYACMIHRLNATKLDEAVSKTFFSILTRNWQDLKVFKWVFWVGFVVDNTYGQFQTLTSGWPTYWSFIVLLNNLCFLMVPSHPRWE